MTIPLEKIQQALGLSGAFGVVESAHSKWRAEKYKYKKNGNYVCVCVVAGLATIKKKKEEEERRRQLKLSVFFSGLVSANVPNYSFYFKFPLLPLLWLSPTPTRPGTTQNKMALLT